MKNVLCHKKQIAHLSCNSAPENFSVPLFLLLPIL